ncbi:uncharacterized protein LOC117649292 isoform X2 [Thrips palmi]|nr:uncharacterized protein LOC117649292 isoform X2 [Thrips palmi]
MQKWTQEMTLRETLLKSAVSLNTEEAPAVRNSSVAKTVSPLNKMNKSTSPKPKEKSLRKCAPNDYTFWDKFDADSEVLKMDLEEERLAERKTIERMQSENHQRQKDQQKSEEDEALHNQIKDNKDVVGAGDSLSLPEREFNALQEKIKGNEYFRNRDMMKALNHYSLSISFLPNVDAYNNRAQTYLKIEDFVSAVQDCKSVLSMDPLNVKAYYRRGSALFSLEKYQDALDDFEKALEIDPNHKEIQEFAKRVRMKLGIPVSSKRVRVAIHNKNSSSSAVEEVDEADANDKYYPFFNTSPNDDIALNAIGTAKVMCRCSGTPGFIRKVRSLDDIKDHGRLCLRRNSRTHKKEGTTQLLSSNSSGSLKTEGKSSVGNVNSMCSKSQEPYLEKNLNFEGQTNKAMPDKSAPQKSQGTSLALSNLEKLKTPFAFSIFWSSVKNSDDISSVAKALRVLTPEIIPKVVGNKLEAKMLSNFISALGTYFTLDEMDMVLNYLHSFTQLQRFSIVIIMLDNASRKELEVLLSKADPTRLQTSQLLQLYMISTDKSN